MNNSQSESWLKKLKPLKEQIPVLQFDIAICGLFLLRHLNEIFEEQKAKIAEEYGVEESEDEDYYYENAQCFLRKEAQWDEIIRLSQETNIGVLLDNAFKSLEESNKHVKGALPSGFFLSPVFQPKNLNTFINKVSSIYEKTKKEEFIEIFQDFLNQCAIQRSKVEEDKKYTPPSITKLLVALADPYEGNIYDPCFGTAGLLVEATKYIRNQKEKMDNVFFFGQELATDIHQFAKINQAINRCEFKLGEPRNTFSFDLFKDKKMDYILANFPMNKRVEEGRWNSNDERWIQFGMPCNENCAWIQHIIHHLSEEGIAVFLVPQKELDSTGNRRLRKGIIEADLVEVVITLPKNSVYKEVSQLAILVINKNKREKVETRGDKRRTYRKRTKEILFIDAGEDQKVKRGEDPRITKEKSEWIIEIFNSWRYENPESIESFQESQLLRSIGLEEIRSRDYSLSMAQYIERISKEEEKIQKVEEIKAVKRQIEQSLLELFKQDEYWKEEFKKIIEEQEREGEGDEEF